MTRTDEGHVRSGGPEVHKEGHTERVQQALLSLVDLSLSHMVSQMLYEITLRDTALARMTAGFLESIQEGLYGERRPANKNKCSTTQYISQSNSIVK